MRQDRFLLVFLAGIGLLVIVAVVLFFVRQNTRTYGPDDTPEGVLRNYVLAINREDYARAYDYLLETDTKPDLERFQRDLRRKSGIIDRTALKIISVDHAVNEAEIRIILSREGAGLFDPRYSAQQTIVLVFQDGAWKISRMPYPFGY